MLRREVGPVAGGEDALSFDLLGGVMTVSGAASAAAIISAVHRAGLRAELIESESAEESTRSDEHRRNRELMTTLSGLFAAAGFATHATMAGGVLSAIGSEGVGSAADVPWIARGLYLVGVAAGLRFVVRKAWGAARRLRPDMNLLMTVAVLGAIALGEWFEAATVAFLFALSLSLEAWSIGRARRAVAALLDLSPQTARVKTGGGEQDVPVAAVAVGSVVVIRPGDRVPLDGIILAGASSIDQAPITGESLPVPKEPGASVFAGSINGEGSLEIRTTHASTETTLARITRMVRDAQSKRGSAELWVDRFASRYTPIVMALALLIAVVPPLLQFGDWGQWAYRSLVLLVIACPCALVISTPVSIVAALAAAARVGVLLKGGRFLEVPARLRAIAFDKTGTVTEGRLRVTHIEALNGYTEREVMTNAAALEARSAHPLARAITEHAIASGIQPIPADNVALVPGRGATGSVDGKLVWVGSHRYLEERRQEQPEVHESLERLSLSGNSVVVVGDDRSVHGVIALADKPRAGIASLLEELRGLGILRLVMLTGDNHGTARAVGRATGFDEIHGELLPEDKVAAIRELSNRIGCVAMVGDGVNDAPALAVADVSIAMGAAGSDAAIESADVALMSDDLSKIPWLIRHSHRTGAVIRQNIVLSLSVKALFVWLTLVGGAALWSAIAADMGASLLVIANALRLLRARAQKFGPTR